MESLPTNNYQFFKYLFFIFLFIFIFYILYLFKYYEIENYEKIIKKPDILRKPYMGFNTWSAFGSDISEKLIMELVDIIYNGPLAKAGYNYIIIDDGWALSERDLNDNLQPDPKKFPNGLKYLSNYIHSKGLKLGIYTSAGSKTCQGLAGSKDFEEQDASLFKSWSVDLVKCDFCGGSDTFYKFWPNFQYKKHYGLMAEYLYDTKDYPYYQSSGIVYNICNWGLNNPETWASTMAHSWRIDFDIRPSFISVLRCFDNCIKHNLINGPNNFNDPDMLVVGTKYYLDSLTDIENETHFCLWVLLAAPLVLSCSLKDLSEKLLGLITNKELIEINQDPLCLCCQSIYSSIKSQILVKKLVDGYCVALLNRSNKDLELSVDLSTISNKFPKNIRDLLLNNLENTQIITKKVPSHGISIFKIS